MNTSLPAAAPNTSSDSPLRQLLAPSLRCALFMCLLTGLAYPLASTGAGQLLFPQQANGSVLHNQGQAVGSALIGQAFSSPRYFQPRPSMTAGTPYNAAASGASNQGATNPNLRKAVQERAAAYRQLNGLAADAQIPVDALTASGSGLDPHISVANAQLQIQRVAQQRKLSLAQVQSLVQAHTEARTLLLLGEPRVHVLRLNLALDALPTTH